MTSLAAAERAALVAALGAVPASAPTLCEGWTALDLAAHIVARERRPDSAPGLLVPALAGWTERVRKGYARRPYPEVIRLIADGPPWSSLFAIPGVDAAANLTEFLIHTEDVRRAGADREPRALDDEQRDAYTKALARGARLFFRRAEATVVLSVIGGPEIVLADRGPRIVLSGDPVELLLYASGRGAHARVTVEGDPDARDRFARLRLGF